MSTRFSRISGSLLAACVWTLAATSPTPLAAQPSENDLAYEAAVGDALTELKAGRLPEARALFLRAHALKPSARTLRGLGVVALEQRHYAEADTLLRQALDDPRRPLTDRQRAEAEQALGRLSGLLGRYTVSVTPPHAKIHVDGAPVTLRAGLLTLEIGTHTLTASAAGHQPYRRKLEVRGGESERLTFALLPVQLAAPVASAPVAPAHERPPPSSTPRESDAKRSDRVWGFTSIAVGGALGATGSVLLAIGLKDVSKVEDAEDGTLWSDIESSRERAPILTSVGAAGIGAGLASAALGLWLLQRRPRAERDTVDVALSPYGISLRGRI